MKDTNAMSQVKQGSSTIDIKICNPKEDQYGNFKENIFLAFVDEKCEQYLGSAFVYQSINYHQTHETPHLIFIGTNIAGGFGKSIEDEIRQKLFNKVFARAKELCLTKPELKARIYAGFEYDKELLAFYVKNGFEEDFSIIMEAAIPDDFGYLMPENIKVSEWDTNSEYELSKYKEMYDEIFVTPLDIDALKEQTKKKLFKNLNVIIDGRIQGGCTVFENDGYGYIETMYVLPEKRGQGIAKEIMSFVFDYFLANGLKKTKLEVWMLNHRAVKLYEAFGYHEVDKNLMFPGITL